MRLHHIAYVTRDVEAKASTLCRLLGFRPAGQPVADPAQGVRILFLDMGTGPQLELLEPLGPDSPVQRRLDKGGGLFHLCFEVDDLDQTLETVRQEGPAVVVREPIPAPAIQNRRVAFVVTAEGDLMEFVQAAPPSQEGGRP